MRFFAGPNETTSRSEIPRFLYVVNRTANKSDVWVFDGHKEETRMKSLIIIGARGAGREVYVTACNDLRYGKDYVVKGFLDGKKDALDGLLEYPPILSSVEDYHPQPNDVFTCALGDPKWRKYYAEIIERKGGEFITLIDKGARIGRNVKIGKGCIIRNFVDLSADISIGDFVYIQPLSIIGHDCIIGDYCHLNCYSFMGGFCHLEDMATIHTGGKVLPHVKIGTASIVGAGAVVVKSVAANKTVVGNPAYVFEY